MGGDTGQRDGKPEFLRKSYGWYKFLGFFLGDLAGIKYP